MAIDRIPGVGPQNSDIASTIATTPAVSAQITANVPTAAAIATAVAAPSSATIQSLIQTYAAPASVTMAAITSSITTNAASAGVTNASIATQVANNAPSPNAWTLVGSSGLTGVNTHTFSSLSGYKTYRLIVISANVASGVEIGLRINGDTTAGNYQGLLGTSVSVSKSYIHWLNTNTTALNAFGGHSTVDIYNANIASPKRIGNGTTATNSGSVAGTDIISGMWKGTATITSITTFNATNADNFTQGTVYLLGAN